MSKFTISVENTDSICPIGETYGTVCIEEGKIPVISCEGACIRGEIARLAANMLARHEPYRRACHGEMFTAPHSAFAKWARQASKVVVIDGCFMKCHGRILKNIIAEDRVAQYDALAIYKKYTDLMDVDDLPEQERKNTAAMVVDAILDDVRSAGKHAADAPSRGCCSERSC